MCLSTIKWTDFLLFEFWKTRFANFVDFGLRRLRSFLLWEDCQYEIIAFIIWGVAIDRNYVTQSDLTFFPSSLEKCYPFTVEPVYWFTIQYSILLRCKCHLSLRHYSCIFLHGGGMSKYGRYCNQVLNFLTVLGKQTACVGMPDRGL